MADGAKCEVQHPRWICTPHTGPCSRHVQEGTTVPIVSQPGKRHPDLRPLCDLSRAQGCIAHRSPSDIGEGNCHPHSGEELRVAAPQRVGGDERWALCWWQLGPHVTSTCARATVYRGDPWQLHSPPQSPRSFSITPVSRHSPPLPPTHPLGHMWWRSAPTVTSPLERGQPRAAGLASPYCGCSATVPPPRSCGPTSPDLRRTGPSSQLASVPPESEMDQEG